MARWIRAVALPTVLVACGLPTLVAAQSVIPGELNNAARAGENFLRQQQEIQDERQRQRDRTQQQPGGESLSESKAAAAGSQAEGQCVEAKALEIVGARLLPKDQIARMQRDIVGRCVGTRDLNILLQRITDLYVARGYVTTRAYIPAQDTQGGHLTIVVIEGKVEKIEVKPRGSASAATAFPGMRGEVFNLRDAEQGIDQLNRLSSNNAKIDIRPGSTPGASMHWRSTTHRRAVSVAHSRATIREARPPGCGRGLRRWWRTTRSESTTDCCFPIPATSTGPRQVRP